MTPEELAKESMSVSADYGSIVVLTTPIMSQEGVGPKEVMAVLKKNCTQSSKNPQTANFWGKNANGDSWHVQVVRK